MHLILKGSPITLVTKTHFKAKIRFNLLLFSMLPLTEGLPGGKGPQQLLPSG